MRSYAKLLSYLAILAAVGGLGGVVSLKEPALGYVGAFSRGAEDRDDRWRSLMGLGLGIFVIAVAYTVW